LEKYLLAESMKGGEGAFKVGGLYQTCFVCLRTNERRRNKSRLKRSMSSRNFMMKKWKV
jgi:hypothetical protein